MKCDNCMNYMEKLDTCKFCSYEEKEVDIVEIKDYYRLYDAIKSQLYSIGVIHPIIYVSGDLNIAYLYGCNTTVKEIAKALNIPICCISVDYIHDIMILNLLEEKLIRFMKDKDWCTVDELIELMDLEDDMW